MCSRVLNHAIIVFFQPSGTRRILRLPHGLLFSLAPTNLNPACLRFRESSYWLLSCQIPTDGLTRHTIPGSSLRICLQRSGSARLTAQARHLPPRLSPSAYLPCWSLLRPLTLGPVFHGCSSDCLLRWPTAVYPYQGRRSLLTLRISHVCTRSFRSSTRFHISRTRST